MATADTAQNLENLRAAHDGNQREAERNIQAVRDTMEQLRNDYEEKLDNERAVNQGAQRESEANIQALRDTNDSNTQHNLPTK